MAVRLLHKELKLIVTSAENLEDLEKKVNTVLDSLDKHIKLAFVAGPISAKTKLGKMYNRYKLDILTEKIAHRLQHENFLTLSSAITPRHLEKFSVDNFYDAYDRISDRGKRLYLTGSWRKSKGALGEYERAKKRGIDIFEVRESFTWVPLWFRKIFIVKM